MSKRKVKDSSALTLLRREIKQVCVERQSWATACGAEKCRRQRLEVELAEARTEVAEWKIRFDRLLSMQGQTEQMTLVGAFGISSDATKSIEREGWDCDQCGHRHAGRAYANICIGCPCQSVKPTLLSREDVKA